MTTNPATIAFKDLPNEIHYMILKEALPKLAPHPWSFEIFNTAERPYCEAILCLATVSRSILAIVHYLLSAEVEQEARRNRCDLLDILDMEYCWGCRTQEREYILFITRVSLQRIIDTPRHGITVAI